VLDVVQQEQHLLGEEADRRGAVAAAAAAVV